MHEHEPTPGELRITYWLLAIAAAAVIGIACAGCAGSMEARTAGAGIGAGAGARERQTPPQSTSTAQTTNFYVGQDKPSAGALVITLDETGRQPRQKFDVFLLTATDITSVLAGGRSLSEAEALLIESQGNAVRGKTDEDGMWLITSPVPSVSAAWLRAPGGAVWTPYPVETKRAEGSGLLRVTIQPKGGK